MASVSLSVDVNKAIKELEGDVSDLLRQADKKFKVAGARTEVFAKATAPVDKGFHQRNIRHVPGGFLETSVQAAAKYASVLEFGFNGIVNVRAHSRKVTSVFGATVGTFRTEVSAHTRQMNRPARPHIVPAAERALKLLITDLEGLKV